MLADRFPAAMIFWGLTVLRGPRRRHMRVELVELRENIEELVLEERSVPLVVNLRL
jgi:hypothetical protein